MKIREIIGALEQFAPLSLQDSYDNAGLQIGLTGDADASGALLCLDITEDVIDEAVARRCNLIVAHHPLLFRPPKHIVGEDYVQRCIIKAIKSDVAVYAAHTNLDNAPGGVSWRMARKLGLQQVQTLKPCAHSETPEANTGAGVIGVLPQSLALDGFIAKVKETFHADSVRFNNWRGKQVQRVALCGGAGAFLMEDAVRCGADAFITGEIGYHRFFGYENDILLMEIGHFESERFTLELLRDIIAAQAPDLPVIETNIRTNPIHYR